MDIPSAPESIGSFIHKESSKEKQKSKAYSLMAKGKSLKAKGSSVAQAVKPDFNLLEAAHQAKAERQLAIEEQANKDLSSYRLEKLRANAAIDQFLDQLLTNELIAPSFRNFHAKAIHTLSLTVCQRLAIEAVNGRTPQKLYAYKVKGAMQLHYKQVYDAAGLSAQQGSMSV